MPVELLTSASDLAAWDELVQRSPAGTLFHSTAWRKGAEWRAGDRMLYTGWRAADGQLRGGMAICERRKWGLRLGAQPLGTPYLGFIADDIQNSGNFSNMRRELFAWAARRFHHAYFQTPPEWPGPPESGRLPRGWEAPERQTPIVALDGGEEKMWSGLRGNARRIVRRAREAGWEIAAMDRAALFPDEREALGRLLAATHRRVGGAIYPEPFVERVLASEALTPHRFTLWARPGLGAAPGAMLTIVFDARRAYYLLPLAEEDSLKAGAMVLLIWEAMRRLAQMGISSLDLLGANRPHLARFKENFSPELLTYHQWRCCSNPFLRVAFSLRSSA